MEFVYGTKRMRDRISLQMERFKALPDGVEEYIKSELFPSETYDFVAFRNDERKAYCTACKSEFDSPKLKHNKEAVCPNCGRKLHAVNTKIRKNGDEFLKWFTVIDEDDGDVLVNCVRVTLDYDKTYRKKVFYYDEMARMVVEEHSADWFEYAGNDRWRPWNDYGMFGQEKSEWSHPRELNLFNKSLKPILDKTWAKYSGLEEFIKSSDSITTAFVVRFLQTYKQNHAVERLAKIGFSNLIVDYPSCIGEGKEIHKAMGLPRCAFNTLRAIGNPDGADYRILKNFPTLSLEGAIEMRKYTSVFDKHFNYCFRDLVDLFKPGNKASKFVAYQKKDGFDIRTYEDYIKMAKQCQYDLTDEYYLFPKDLKRAHDRLVEESNKAKIEEAKRLEEAVRLLQRGCLELPPMSMKENGLMIMLPNEENTLKGEGIYLHHCVGSYVDRVKSGRTMIFFIRKESEPNTPYYTMEWNGKIAQLRGAHNCDPTEEVRCFANKFDLEMRKFIDKTPLKKAA